MTNHQLAKFVGHRHCGSGNIMILGCHVILQDRVMKSQVTLWPEAHQGKQPSCQVWLQCF